MCEEQRVNRTQFDTRLKQTLRDAAPAINQQTLPARLHQYTGAEAPHAGRRTTGSQQGDAKFIACRRDHLLRCRTRAVQSAHQSTD
jgi:hypothetical protein